MQTYLEVGELLNRIDIKYGKSIIKEYSSRLTIRFGKKYTVSLLYKIKQFYSIIQKVPTLSGKLTWSHWYENNNIDVRGLRNKIKSKEYERLDNKTKYKLICQKEYNIVDFVKNPILIKNNYKYENISEEMLQKLILEDIPTFLKELGIGFSFIDNEYKIKMGDRYNYIDLFLYNIKYKCYVVIELKVTELNFSHTGQIQNYMNYIDKNVKSIEDNKTVGIIICKRENKYVIEYCSDKRIVAKHYELV